MRAQEPAGGIAVSPSKGEAPHAPGYYVGKKGIWSIQVRNHGVATVTVKIIEAREKFGRVDLLIETDTGARVWVSNQTVSVPRAVRM